MQANDADFKELLQRVVVMDMWPAAQENYAKVWVSCACGCKPFSSCFGCSFVGGTKSAVTCVTYAASDLTWDSESKKTAP